MVRIKESRRIEEGECWISGEGRKELGLLGIGMKGGEGIELLKCVFFSRSLNVIWHVSA